MCSTICRRSCPKSTTCETQSPNSTEKAANSVKTSRSMTLTPRWPTCWRTKAVSSTWSSKWLPRAPASAICTGTKSTRPLHPQSTRSTTSPALRTSSSRTCTMLNSTGTRTKPRKSSTRPKTRRRLSRKSPRSETLGIKSTSFCSSSRRTKASGSSLASVTSWRT